MLSHTLSVECLFCSSWHQLIQKQTYGRPLMIWKLQWMWCDWGVVCYGSVSNGSIWKNQRKYRTGICISISYLNNFYIWFLWMWRIWLFNYILVNKFGQLSTSWQIWKRRKSWHTPTVDLLTVVVQFQKAVLIIQLLTLIITVAYKLLYKTHWKLETT